MFRKKIIIFMQCFIMTLISLILISCDTNDNTQNNVGLIFKTIDVVDNIGYIKVSNSTQEFSFTDEIEMLDTNTKYVVSLDKYGSQIVWSKIVPLDVGNNVFYVFETRDGDTKKLYEITIRRKDIYSVSFKNTNEEQINTLYVEEDSFAPEPAAIERKGYDFVGWSYNFSNPITKNTVVEPKWKIITFNITYILNEGTNNFANPITYTVEDEVSLVKPTRNGYFFIGWSENGKIEKGSIGDKTFTAKWYNTYYRKDNCIYFGYYPQTQITKETLIETLDYKAGELPTIENNHFWTSYEYYYDGRISEYMWYIDVEYDGFYYRGVYFEKYRPSSALAKIGTEQQANGYKTNTIYWFEYEPLKWQILCEEDGKALILCESIIDTQQFYNNGNTRTLQGDTVYANNYYESDIRKWLNNTFFQIAFSDLQKNLFSTASKNNDDTNDPIILLTVADATNSSYGFKNSTIFGADTAKQMNHSDYALAQGLETNNWWLKNIDETGIDGIMVLKNGGISSGLDDDGNPYEGYFEVYNLAGIVPACWIVL